MNPWAYVLLGGVFETVWSSTMMLSDGFRIPEYVVLTILFLIISTMLLNIGLKSGLPVGVCYAVWVGVGAIGSVLAGLLFFGDAICTVGFVFLAMIIVGVIGINMSEGDAS